MSGLMLSDFWTPSCKPYLYDAAHHGCHYSEALSSGSNVDKHHVMCIASQTHFTNALHHLALPHNAKKEACLQNFGISPSYDFTTCPSTQGLLVWPQGLDGIKSLEMHLQDNNASAAEPGMAQAQLLLPPHLPLQVFSPQVLHHVNCLSVVPWLSGQSVSCTAICAGHLERSRRTRDVAWCLLQHLSCSIEPVLFPLS